MPYNPYALAGILGGVGGFVRSLVGFLKALSLKKKILFWYWFLTVLISVIIGIFVGIVFGLDPRLSLLAGYAGTDLLEGAYKIARPRNI